MMIKPIFTFENRSNSAVPKSKIEKLHQIYIENLKNRLIALIMVTSCPHLMASFESNYVLH